MLNYMLNGVIFDFDGVIINSEKHHKKSWYLLSKEIGKVIPADYHLKILGRRNIDTIPNFFKWSQEESEIRRLADRKEELYRDIIKKERLEIIPGLKKLLDEIREDSIKCAIGSSTERKNIDLALGLLGLESYFSEIVTGDDVNHGKPHPEVYIKASKLIRVPPAECIVIEDAPSGIKASLTAGMKVIGIASTHKIEDLYEATHAVENLTQISLSDLRKIIQVSGRALSLNKI